LRHQTTNHQKNATKNIRESLRVGVGHRSTALVQHLIFAVVVVVVVVVVVDVHRRRRRRRNRQRRLVSRLLHFVRDARDQNSMLEGQSVLLRLRVVL
jgi:heme A synthase